MVDNIFPCSDKDKDLTTKKKRKDGFGQEIYLIQLLEKQDIFLKRNWKRVVKFLEAILCKNIFLINFFV